MNIAFPLTRNRVTDLPFIYHTLFYASFSVLQQSPDALVCLLTSSDCGVLLQSYFGLDFRPIRPRPVSGIDLATAGSLLAVRDPRVEVESEVGPRLQL